jgi:hypothetical protein
VSRAPATYREGGDFAPAAGFSVEIPTAGHYRFRLVRGGHPVAIRVWFGPPLDPVTGEELDRSHRWQASCNGAPIDLARVWPFCAREPIDEREAAYLSGLQAWAQENAPLAPQADPTRKIDLLDPSTPIPL